MTAVKLPKDCLSSASFTLTVAAFLALSTFACGSRLNPQEEGSSRTTANSPSADANAKGGRCKLSDVSSELKAKGFQKIDVNSLEVKTPDGHPKSLCEYLYDYQSEVAIIQFAGVTCLSCQDEAAMFAADLKIKSPYGNKIAHIVALTDFLSDYTEEDFQNFMTKYAPNSLRAHDSDIKLWRYFSADPNTPVRPTIVAYNRSGWSFVMNQEGSDPKFAETAANVLAKTASSENLKPATPSTISTVTPTPTTPSVVPTPILPTSSPTVAPTITPTATPGGASKPLTLTPSQNVTLKESTGQTSNLASYFENNDYLVIDLSQYYCSYCRTLANQHNSSTSFQSKMTGGKCKALTVVPNGDLSLWSSAYPSSTFTGSTSRGISSLSGVASAFGVNFGGTPTVFIINRSGKLIDQQVGSVPSGLNSLCQ